MFSDTTGHGVKLKKHLRALNVWLSVQVRQHGLQSDVFGAGWLLKTCYCASNTGTESISMLETYLFQEVLRTTISPVGFISYRGLSGDDGHAVGFLTCL